ncbi:hypothetical protein HPP_1920 [Hydrangea phyllody phytoplasma]|uniref:Uncharacterized protein n=2 Tax=16SrI (Aster yellows group) TaxID=3042590 RepID=A0ABQ5PSH0_9MOLU|nr:hypothetical protein [Hydrangea phyllody phytoplasma]GFZ75234.1 hypothetical protein HPP_1920 [Hydrangea phyllody phytoplasma]GLH61174.1 hypothetical protein RHYP_1190 [Rhus yellows phytoplasma]GLH61848.1 hypothetical protein HP2P_2550 [Hydrangea phyllody phytoplasma]
MKNIYQKQPCLKQRFIYCLSALLLWILFVISFNYTLKAAPPEPIDISTIEKNIGSFESAPNDKKIIEKIVKNQKNISGLAIGDDLEVVSINNNKATVKAKENSKKIKGQVEVIFNVKEDLNVLIQNKALGDIELNKIHSEALISNEDLLNAIESKNNGLVITKEDIYFPKKDRSKGYITIEALDKSPKYKGKAKLTYQIKKINKEEFIAEVKKEYNIPFDSPITQNQLDETIENVIAEEVGNPDSTKDLVMEKVQEAVALLLNDGNTLSEKLTTSMSNKEGLQNNSQTILSPKITSEKTDNDENTNYGFYIVIACIILISITFLSLLFVIFKKRNTQS